MRITDDKNEIRYTATEGQTDFVFDFPVFYDSHLLVYDGVVADDLTSWTKQDLGSDFTMVHTDTDKKTGNVVFNIGRTAGHKILIMRQVPLTQLSEYVDDDRLPATVFETDINLGIMIDQQHRRELAKCFKLPSTSAVENLVVPEPAAGKFLYWVSDSEMGNREISDMGMVALPLSESQGGSGQSSFADALDVHSVTRSDAATIWAKIQSMDTATLEIDAGACVWDMSQETGKQGAILTMTEPVSTFVLSGHGVAGAFTIYTLMAVQDTTGGRTLDMTGIKCPGATAVELSTAANAIDILTILSDGVNAYCVGVLNFG
jgi:hypothetical protein